MSQKVLCGQQKKQSPVRNPTDDEIVRIGSHQTNKQVQPNFDVYANEIKKRLMTSKAQTRAQRALEKRVQLQNNNDQRGQRIACRFSRTRNVNINSNCVKNIGLQSYGGQIVQQTTQLQIKQSQIHRTQFFSPSERKVKPYKIGQSIVTKNNLVLPDLKQSDSSQKFNPLIARRLHPELLMNSQRASHATIQQSNMKTAHSIKTIKPASVRGKTRIIFA